jgi:hypothetical protein
MSGPQPAPSAFHRPADVARILGCSEWWVKEQARRRRVPYCWIGGSYRFTDAHVAEIARLFEVRPVAEVPTSSGRATSTRHSRPAVDTAPDRQPTLDARPPRRMRQADADARSAA